MRHLTGSFSPQAKLGLNRSSEVSERSINAPKQNWAGLPRSEGDLEARSAPRRVLADVQLSAKLLR
jgi:hypothetical protein